jgi:hypothetical protein
MMRRASGCIAHRALLQLEGGGGSAETPCFKSADSASSYIQQ